MRKAWRLPIGSVIIKRSGDPLFEATVTKIGWNKWIHFRKTDITEPSYYTNRQVQALMDDGLMKLIRDYR
jgi:hypothetical protein